MLNRSLIILFFIPGLAICDFVFEGKTFKSSIDLSDFFNKIIPQEGQTCHIYSAVSLMEAFCFKKTKEHLKISEAYFHYQHLANNFGDIYLEDFYQDPFFGDLDRGFPEITLQRFKDKSVVLESELPMEKYLDSFQEAKMAAVNNTLDSFWNYLDQNLFSFLKEHQVQVSKSSDGLSLKTSDVRLKTCLENPMKIKTRNFSIKMVLRLLNSNIPFVCADGQWKTQEGQVINHAFTVVGYRLNPDKGTVEDHLEFKIRDSNNPVEENWTNLASFHSCKGGVTYLK